MNNDDITTKPTIETVLEKINTLGEQLNGQLAELRNGQDELRRGQVEMRNDIADLNVGQRKLVRRIETLNDNILTLQTDNRADMNAFDRRLDRLESKSK